MCKHPSDYTWVLRLCLDFSGMVGRQHAGMVVPSAPWSFSSPSWLSFPCQWRVTGSAEAGGWWRICQLPHLLSCFSAETALHLVFTVLLVFPLDCKMLKDFDFRVSPGRKTAVTWVYSSGSCLLSLFASLRASPLPILVSESRNYISWFFCFSASA